MKNNDSEEIPCEKIEISLNEMESIILTLKSKIANIKESIKEGTVQAEVLSIQKKSKGK